MRMTWPVYNMIGEQLPRELVQGGGRRTVAEIHLAAAGRRGSGQHGGCVNTVEGVVGRHGGKASASPPRGDDVAVDEDRREP